ncbi:MAG: hypothetical protein RLY86_1692 [Pseudomonadota bacterium]|jgi:predicted O-linked N-acetylglucosamine transferase (SPINDLY family)
MTDDLDAALALHKAGDLVAAEAAYRAMLRQAPNHPHACNNLGILLRRQRRWEEAIDCYQRALQATPQDEQIYNNLTCALCDLGQMNQAMRAVRIALLLRPDYAGAWFNLGNLLRDSGDPAGAAAAYHRAIRLQPDMGEAYSNLGDIHKSAVDLTLAAECYATALRLQPHLPQPYVNLGEVLKEQGRVVEAITLFQHGLDRHPTLAVLHSNLLFALHYTPHVPPEVIFRAHRHWGERHAAGLGPPPGHIHANDRTPSRRLRIGYVSPDFCNHAVACFLEPLLRAHDRSAVEIFCYAISRRQDATTRRFQAIAGHWCSLVMATDEEAAARITADRIDILVDLSGHTADARPLLFARKPAPVQVSWLGYPDTTGLAAIDYRLTDAIADPPGDADRRHLETLVRLPRGFLAFRPPVQAEVQPVPPCVRTGVITLGSFNNNAKVTPEVVAVWSQILHRLPTARLMLKSRSFADAATHRRYAGLFAGHGIAEDRIDLLPFLPDQQNHLRAYDRLDIALDPFPYSGTTTSCEALWMGVPVVTLAGSNHVGRVTASLLTGCGLAELVATDTADYVDRAVALAMDRARLATLRAGMRARLLASPLADHDGFARQVEDAYRTMWMAWTSQGDDAAADRRRQEAS